MPTLPVSSRTNPIASRAAVKRFVALSALVAGGVVCLSPRPAAGWNFVEHTELGQDGYQDACDQLAVDLKLAVRLQNGKAPAGPAGVSCENATDDATVRWCLACRTYSPALYGQSVAIAGDHVGSPEELMSPAGQQVAASLGDYISLALVNVEHFRPAAPGNWRTFHTRALDIATTPQPGASLSQVFAQVFFTSAFADHFLQDSFAAGHAGFNRPASGAAASVAFHNLWNASGRLVRTPAGECWLEYGDGKLHYLTQFGRDHISAAEKASVLDVLTTFVTGKRDSAREIRPVYFIPSETTPNPLPGTVWAHSGIVAEPTEPPKIVGTMYKQQVAGLDRDNHACTVETVPIDGMSNPSRVNAGIDFWAGGYIDRTTTYGSLDAIWNHGLVDIMSVPFYYELGISPLGYVERDSKSNYTPGILAGVVLPPVYLAHGLWRNEIGFQARSYLTTTGSTQINGYGTASLRSSIEASTTVIRLQAGPTIDLRTGRIGVQAAFGVELAPLRWITGGGAMTSF